MKERHPIDDLFREGLYNSEAVPPADVWQRVVAQRSWGHRLLAGLKRRWAVGVLAVALVCTPVVWYAGQGDANELAGAKTSGPTEVVGEVTPTVVPAVIGAEANGVPVQEANAAQGVGTDALSDDPVGSPAGVATNASAPAHRNAAEGAQQVAQVSARSAAEVASGSRNASRGAAQETALAAGTLSGGSSTQPIATSPASSLGEGTTKPAPNTGSDHDAVLAQTSAPATSSSSTTSGVGVEDYVDEEFLKALSRSIPYTRVPDSALLIDRPLDAPYVLTNGAWWVGIQFGWNEWNGGWTGPSPLVEEMNDSEEWQSGWQVGAVGGRTWKSGLSVSLGAEVASLRSRFLFNEPVQGDSSDGFTTVLDTTWQVNAVAPDSSYVVYTYSIDMVEVPIGDSEVKYNATNRYTLLNFPVELAWQKNVKRFTFAPRVGIAASLFMARNGNTLMSNTIDGRATTISASDPRADAHFSALLMGNVGMDVGYALNERVQLQVGPGYSTVLTSFGNGDLRPAINGLTVRGRLVYEFGMKQRQAKP